MIHMSYDWSLVLGSALLAIVICFCAISLHQLILKQINLISGKIILFFTGLIFGFAIWAMHFVGVLACKFPEYYYFDKALTIYSYIIAAVACIFAMWLTSRSNLPYARLILGAIVMGIAISGMHYVGMAGLRMPGYYIYYDPLIFVFSVLIAVCGSGLAFWLAFKLRGQFKYYLLYKFSISVMLALSIIGMHYAAMAGTHFYKLNEPADQIFSYQGGQGLLIFTIIFVISLVLMGIFFVAVLEIRLEERNKQLMMANKELQSLAMQDNLTKLPNRLFLIDYTDYLFSSSLLKEQLTGLIYLDIDRLKSINDAFGHHVGDELLLKFSSRIYRILNERQKLIRLGGDEFLLIVENTTHDEMEYVATQILNKINHSFKINDKEINITVSMGVVFYPEHGKNLQDLLINADTAMQISKEQGRNTYSVFNYSTDQQFASKNKLKLVNDLYKAVEEQQFILFYQPKFNVEYAVCGVEALIRWKHPTLGLLAPCMFIEGAEQTGLIIRMGYWALEEACKQIQIWNKNGLNFAPVSVNLSVVQFEHKNLIDTLQELIVQYDIKAGQLKIEITESTAMHHIGTSIRTFEKLREIGVGLAIDDFGTGHSSFLYLKDLPVDELKIDKEFICGLSVGSKEEIILESIIRLANRLGLTITAEGVETPKQAEILKRLGCQQFQGYLFSMPVPVERLEENYKHQVSNEKH
ncbi:bifunctional diguanylate cyclase/phosphodiesterase [Acinetobacter stercoris]|uniref:Cyclic di-GMP phosphodiesterase Gmr n=1 Tax=Acinetobacter stercoris TaxID=2126983 RepID=A0A2U3MXE3_9GAMM|nr:EAL domain-containing protein [Acinetobacter stercoris]SPL70108.1 Cyclic di-GMP phosphodiesterase Gmr [Acinetobacter stercoris]